MLKVTHLLSLVFVSVIDFVSSIYFVGRLVLKVGTGNLGTETGERKKQER